VPCTESRLAANKHASGKIALESLQGHDESPDFGAPQHGVLLAARMLHWL
jgi:hypothetical protein